MVSPTIALAAATLDTDVTPAHANNRELESAGLSPFDFPLYMPIPHLAASEKIAGLSWDPTPLREAFAETIEDHLNSGRTDMYPPRHDFSAARDVEETLIDPLYD